MKIIDVRVQLGDSGFLLLTCDTAILLDSGFGFTAKNILSKIEKILNGRNLDYIFLTHSHYDHVLASIEIKKHYPKAKIIAGEYAAEIFSRPGAKAKMKDLDNKFASSLGIKNYKLDIDDLRVDITVKDKDRIKNGSDEYQVIALPGHTKCTIGFYCVNQKILLAPETLGVYDGGNVIVPAFLSSYNDTVSSIDKVLQLEIKQIVTAHYGLLNEMQTKFYLRNIKKSLLDSKIWFETRINDKSLSDEQIVEQFKSIYWKGIIKDTYPKDAIELNTSIMIKTIKNKL